MPDDKKLDLSSNLGDFCDADLLKDVAAATEHMKRRQAADRAKEAAEKTRSSSRKTSALLIAVGAVLVLLISYWMVFARSGDEEQASLNGPITPTAEQSQAINGQIQQPHVTTAPVAPPRAAPPVGRDSQTLRHPPEGYEQPNYDPGM